MKCLIPTLIITLAATAASAQSWTLDDKNNALIPKSISGTSIKGALLTCVGNRWSLKLNAQFAAGSAAQDLPAALVVGDQIFPTSASKETFEIAVPDDAIAALKSGSKLVVSLSYAGITMKPVFSLRGSSKALAETEKNCGLAATIAQPKVVTPAISAVTLNAPGKIEVGQKIEIEFTGPDAKGDWIGVVNQGAKATAYIGTSYAYTKYGSPAKISVPSISGDYEIRYIDDKNKKILLSKPLTIEAGEPVTLSGPATAVGGLPVKVDFTGPRGPTDFIAIVPSNAKSNARVGGHWAGLRKRNSVTMRAPLNAGKYEVRYVVRGAKYQVVKTQNIEVSNAPTVTLKDVEAAAGSEIEIALPDAPRAKGDRLYIAPKGLPDKDYSGGYVNVPRQNSAAIKVPDQAGDWEIRYVVPGNGSYTALGRAALVVK